MLHTQRSQTLPRARNRPALSVCPISSAAAATTSQAEVDGALPAMRQTKRGANEKATSDEATEFGTWCRYAYRCQQPPRALSQSFLVEFRTAPPPDPNPRPS